MRRKNKNIEITKENMHRSFDEVYEVKYTKDLECMSGEVCLLDLVSFKEGEYVFIFQKCKHIFHIECINEWNKNHIGQCPSCF